MRTTVLLGIASGLLAAAAAFSAGCGAQQADDALEWGMDTGSDGKTDGWGSDTSGTLVLRGTVITMDAARGDKQVINNGAVVIKGQKIVDILTSGQPLPTGTGVVYLPSKTGKSDLVITPGLINSHNHLAYNTAHVYRDLPLYENTYQWRDEKYYDTHIQLPKRLLGDTALDTSELGLKPTATGDHTVELEGIIGRYSEAKELAGATTTTQGSYFGSTVHNGYGSHLVRNMDSNAFTSKKRISQTALGVLVKTFDPREVVAKMDRGELDAWLVHLAEGTDQESRDEFDCLKSMGLVRKELMLIHGTGLSDAQLAEMGKVGAKLVASPLDNLLYYGHSADIKTAWQKGVNVSIGSDWSPAGSKNLLVELKVLDRLNQQVWGNYFSTRDMVQMVTTNPADAIGWTKYVGRLQVGLYADIAVFTKQTASTDPYRSVIDATERDVRLVLVGGDPLYGDVTLMKKLKPSDYEQVDTSCGFVKAIDITSTSTKVQHGDLTFTEVRDVLQTALQFDFEWLYAHHQLVKEKNLTRDGFRAELKKKYPFELTPRSLNTMFTCEDAPLLDEIRTDPNIRTAYSGVCLDLRPHYASTISTPADCGPMPTHPHLLTTEEHDGTVPQRAPSWCIGQTWTGTGPLPSPPR